MQFKKAIHLEKRNTAEVASIRIVMLVLVSFALGIGVTVAWFHRGANPNGTTVTAPAPGTTQPSVGQPAPTTGTASSPSPMASPPPIDPATIAEVKKAVPDFATLSQQDAENILRANALQDFDTAAANMDAQIKAAQKQLQDAQNSQTAAEQQAAMKHVQDAQTAGAEKLKEITSHLQAQITALKSLKNQQ
jgi:hypothetical protein